VKIWLAASNCFTASRIRFGPSPGASTSASQASRSSSKVAVAKLTASWGSVLIVSFPLRPVALQSTPPAAAQDIGFPGWLKGHTKAFAEPSTEYSNPVFRI
jgi:hypothetical protein